MEEKRGRGRPKKKPIQDTPKRGRGRPKKIIEQAETVIESIFQPIIVEDKLNIKAVADEVLNEIDNEISETIKQEKQRRKGEWDIKINDPIDFFDATLSYELTGYKPISTTQSLDFNPEWFVESRNTYLRTGHYCSFPRKTKAYNDFWDEQYKRCRDGLTVNGYTVTGDHYFFLNFYQLKDSRVQKAGTARTNIFPRFMQAQYEFFHYYELCKILRKNVCMMKSRAVKSCRLYK